MKEVRKPAGGHPYPPGFLTEFAVPMLPAGYRFAETRFAKLILIEAYPQHYRDFLAVLSEFRIDANELIRGEEGGAAIAARFDSLLSQQSWGNRTLSRTRLFADGMTHAPGGHPIELFGTGPDQGSYPGIAVEMEWNFDWSFLDRVLLNFAALHREGALAIAVLIVTGPGLHRSISAMTETGTQRTGTKHKRTTYGWDDIVSSIHGGLVGGCPLLLVGIEQERVTGFAEVANALGESHML